MTLPSNVNVNGICGSSAVKCGRPDNYVSCDYLRLFLIEVEESVGCDGGKC